MVHCPTEILTTDARHSGRARGGIKMKLTGQEKNFKKTKLKAMVFSYITHKTAQGKAHIFWTYDLNHSRRD